jgi:pimeloyl-ACP methyl ester carboxylesterase
VRIEVHGTGLDVQVSGDGPPVLLLHGFPDSGRLWRHQVGPLTAAGFRVVVPDLRGYGGSDKPDEVGAYAMTALAADVLGILDELGIDRAHVVGHDWGAALAWGLAAVVPDRVDHLVVLSVGHPMAFRDAGLAQREKSWYMLLFQFSGVAEEWLSADGWANFRMWARHPDADGVIRDLETNGSLTPGLAYYRANVAPETWIRPARDLPAVRAPTMGVWSSGDIALTERQMLDSAAHVTGRWRYERLDGVGHWIPLEAPDALNTLLLDFLPAPRPA